MRKMNEASHNSSIYLNKFYYSINQAGNNSGFLIRQAGFIEKWKKSRGKELSSNTFFVIASNLICKLLKTQIAS